MTIRKIKNRFKIIENQISQLVEDKYYFEQFKKYIENNKAINKNNDFLRFIAFNYRDLSIINVCKQADEDERTESLINLLKDIRKHKYFFNLDWFIKKYPKWRQGNGINDFKIFSTNNNKSISCQKINKDVKEIRKTINGSIFGKKRQSTNSLKKFRNKKSAHYDKRNFKTTATMKDVDKAINLLEKMVIKYNPLINQSGMKTLLSSNVDEFIQFNEIFKN